MTPIHFVILKAVATYFTLQRHDIQSLCLPENGDSGRTMRRHLLTLVTQGLLNKTPGEVVFQNRNGAPAPVYFPSRKGLELLATETKDERYLSVCAYQPNWQHLYHWLSVARFHILLDRAAQRNEIDVEHWLGEWDVLNHQEKEPEKRFRLFTVVREQPRLVCAPDASFVLSYKGYRRGYYLEMDRATSGVRQIAASKTGGYAAVAEKGLHARHFPGAENVPFRVLLVTQSQGRRDLLAKEIGKKSGAPLWRFLAAPDLTPESLLHDLVSVTCEGEARPLVKRMDGGEK